jgi:hypothetical protein
MSDRQLIQCPWPAGEPKLYCGKSSFRFGEGRATAELTIEGQFPEEEVFWQMRIKSIWCRFLFRAVGRLCYGIYRRVRPTTYKVVRLRVRLLPDEARRLIAELEELLLAERVG